MDNSRDTVTNPVSNVVSEDRRVTRSVTRSLQTQVVSSIFNRIDTGIERPIDFFSTDYLNRCTDLIFGRPSVNSSVKVSSELAFDSGENSLTFSRKLETLANMSEDQANTDEVPCASGQEINTSKQSASTDQFSQLMALILHQNQMMSNCMSELSKIRGEVASVSHRVTEVECAANASSINAPGSSSTPDKNIRSERTQGCLTAGSDNKSQQHTSSDQSRKKQGSGDDTGNINGTNRRTDDADITFSRRELDDRKPIDLDRWHIKFDGSSRDMTVESFIFRVEKMREQYNVSHNRLFSDFHCLLNGNAAK